MGINSAPFGQRLRCKLRCVGLGGKIILQGMTVFCTVAVHFVSCHGKIV